MALQFQLTNQSPSETDVEVSYNALCRQVLDTRQAYLTALESLALAGAPVERARLDGTAGASFEVAASQVLFLSFKFEQESAGGNYAANGPDKEKRPF